MKLKSTLRSFLAIAGSSLLTITYVCAADYYWDSDNATPGFGSIAATWAAPTTTSLSAPYGFTTDATGSTAIYTPAAGMDPEITTSVTTATADSVFFGTSTVPYTGTITFSGPLSVKSIYACSTHGSYLAAASPVITFDAEGIFESAKDATTGIPAITFDGAATSLTIRATRTLNLASVTNNLPNTSKMILATSPDSTLAIPGRTGITNATLAFATGSITYGTPVDGDTVTVNGVVLTKAAAAGLAEFSTIAELNALVTAISGVDSTENGTVVSITAATAGTGGNAITLAETGAMTVSGATLTGGLTPTLGVGTDLEFNGGILRFVSPSLAYASLSVLNAAHPVTFVSGAKAGFDNQCNGTTFTVDESVNLGASGKFFSEGSNSGLIKLTAANTWAEILLAAGTCEIDNLNQLGTAVRFGSGGTSGGNGTLKILGAITSLGAVTMLTTPDKNVSFNIDSSSNTFTVDQQIASGTGGLSKSGAGTLILDHATANNIYSGGTTVSAGTMNVSNIDADVTGLTSVSGTGILNLATDNSAAIGGVTLTAGTLNVNHAAALGSGPLTLTAGTLKNSVTTLTTNNAVTVGGNFSWDGAGIDLTLGSGAITMAASRTITLVGGPGRTLTFGGVLTNTQAGNPTLTANTAGNTLVIGGGLALSGPTDASNRTVTISGTGNVTINGPVTNGGNGTSTASLLTKTGTGTLTLNGNNTYGGLTTHSTAGSTLTLAGDNSGAAGGITMNNATAVLNVNHAAALGTGTFNLTNGKLDNTSGSPKTLTTNNTVNLGGTATWVGSNDLTFGNGDVNATANGRIINLEGAGSLTFGGKLVNTAAGNTALNVNGVGKTMFAAGLACSNSATPRTFTVQGDGNLTITGAVAGSSLGGSEAIASSLIKGGLGTLTLQGVNTYTGTTTVNTGGCLALVGGSQDSAITVNSGGFLGFTLGSPTTSTNNVTLAAGHKVRITDTPTPGVDYTLLTTSGLIINTPDIETPLATHTLEVEGAGTILVLKALIVSTPFEDWALLKGLDGTVGKENGEADDPDGDGKNNKFEFAFNGNPLSGSDNGMMAGLVQDASAPAGNELTLIVAVRDGATFANAGSPVVQTATKDGVVYTIQGTLDLVTIPGSDVSQAAGPSNTAPAATGLPDLTGTAWEYHTFKLDASEGLGSKGFLRAKAE